jgi:hypothetical protein
MYFKPNTNGEQAETDCSFLYLADLAYLARPVTPNYAISFSNNAIGQNVENNMT